MGLERDVEIPRPAGVPRHSSGEPGRHPATARMRWNKEINKVVMEYFYKSKPFEEEGEPIWAYTPRMFRQWRDRGMTV